MRDGLQMGHEVHEEGREQRRTPAPVLTISNCLLHSVHRGGSGQGKAGNILIHTRAHKTSEMIMKNDCKMVLAGSTECYTPTAHGSGNLGSSTCSCL